MKPPQECYDVVAQELAGKNLKPGLWARAIADAGEEGERARARYIALRADEVFAAQCEAERRQRAEAKAAQRSVDEEKRKTYTKNVPVVDVIFAIVGTIVLIAMIATLLGQCHATW